MGTAATHRNTSTWKISGQLNEVQKNGLKTYPQPSEDSTWREQYKSDLETEKNKRLKKRHLSFSIAVISRLWRRNINSWQRYSRMFNKIISKSHSWDIDTRSIWMFGGPLGDANISQFNHIQCNPNLIHSTTGISETVIDMSEINEFLFLKVS